MYTGWLPGLVSFVVPARTAQNSSKKDAAQPMIYGELLGSGESCSKTIATSEHTEGPQLSGSWKRYLENSPVASEELRKGMQHAG